MFTEPYLRKVESLSSKKVTIKRDLYLHTRTLSSSRKRPPRTDRGSTVADPRHAVKLVGQARSTTSLRLVAAARSVTDAAIATRILRGGLSLHRLRCILSTAGGDSINGTRGALLQAGVRVVQRVNAGCATLLAFARPFGESRG